MMFNRSCIRLSLSPVTAASFSAVLGILSFHYQWGLSSLIGWHVLFSLLLSLIKKKEAILLLLLTSLSFWGVYYRYHQLDQRFISSYNQLSLKPCSAYGKVTTKEELKGKTFSTKLTVALSSLLQENTVVPCSIIISIRTIQRPSLLVGDTIFLKELPSASLQKKLLQQHLFKKGITASLFIPRLAYSLHKRPAYSLERWRDQKRNELAQRFSQRLSPFCYTVFCSLFLGKRCTESAQYKQIQQYCSYWGIMHYMSRSGLHALMVMFTFNMLFRFIPVWFVLKEILLLLFLMTYHIFTWSSIPFARALSSLLLYKLFTLNKICFKTLHVLSIITLGTLFYNPLYLFALDFQLSFGLTWALAWFNEATLIAQRTSSFEQSIKLLTKNTP